MRRGAETALCAFLLLSGSLARADWLNASGQVAEYSPGGRGLGAGLEFGRELRPSALVHIGGFAFDAAGAHWRFGRLGGIWRASPLTTVYGRADLGNGRFSDEARFAYRIYAIGLLRARADRKLEADLEDQYIHVGEAKGHVLKIGGAATPIPGLTARVAFHQSLGGSVEARYWSGRVDLSRQKPYGLLGGVTAGRGRSDIRGLFDAAPSQHSVNVYAGARVHHRTREFTLILGKLRVGAARSHSVQVNCRLPL